MIDYSKKILTDQDIKNEVYKQHIGKGMQWENRGAFQLAFLKALGLTKNKRLLDIGCGPLRAGEHFAPFLVDNYFGTDYNGSYIKIAHQLLENKGYGKLKSNVVHSMDFGFSHFRGNFFDLILCFSVLNNNHSGIVSIFFKHIKEIMHKDTILIITHVSEKTLSQIDKNIYEINRNFEDKTKLPDSCLVYFEAGGWEVPHAVFPILLLKVKNTDN